MQINMTADLNNISNPRIWVLIDNRTGNANQALALASKIGFEYQVKKVRYNILVMLPNFLLGLWPIHVKKSLLDSLKNEDAPDIIISSGRRTASLAVYLKKISAMASSASHYRLNPSLPLSPLRVALPLQHPQK